MSAPRLVSKLASTPIPTLIMLTTSLYLLTNRINIRSLSAMDEEASKFGLHISWSKTKIQNLSCGPALSPVMMNGNIIDPVQEFTYLGSIQSSNSNSTSEYIRRIGLAAGVMKRLDRVWNQMNLSISTKIRIYSTCVLAVLLYGSEIWTLTQPDWRRLDSFHTRCQ